MHRRLLLIPALLLSALLVGQAGSLSDSARQRLRGQESDLAQLAHAMHTDSSEERRFLACRELIKELVVTLQTPNSFAFPFDSLPGVVVATSPDSAFRTFTWELHVDADNYRHFGAMQHNAAELQLTPLIDRGDAARGGLETSVLTAEDWLGYVVYDIIPAGRRDGEPQYFLFGFDRYAKFHRRKILDVLSFTGADTSPVFGAPIFKSYNESGLYMPDRTRLILRYGAEVNAVLRYDAFNRRVVYENLIMIEGTNGEGPIMVPDGSYHALELTGDGVWVETDRVYDHKFDAAPTTRRADTTRKDLFGRKKN